VGDVGLFGPGSITWRLHADPLMGVAGLRALLMQALHPVAMAAVTEHSRFPADLWGRLREIADHVGVTTFGSTQNALLAGARRRAVHATVIGTEPGTGRPYRGDDEALLLWWHCCLVDSFLDVVGRGGTAVSQRDADTYVTEQVRSAALLGLEPDVVPTTVAALAEHLARTRTQLAVTSAAREAARVLVAESSSTRADSTTPAPPAWAGVAGVAFAALPSWARSMYALPELPGASGLTDAATTVALRALRAGLCDVPTLVHSGKGSPDLRDQRGHW
jgi:uncharacterized protein (DUF2236 family)